MDLMKIGRYIAGKRKAQGLTQREVAERLNMSDKSVSKWERGVCLPDVSVYQELCDILDISINEFLAGEDIPAEALPKKCDETLIQVSADSRDKQRSLRRAIVALAAALAAIMLAGAIGLTYANRPQNHLEPVDPHSIEAQTANMLAGPDGAHLFRYTATDPFRTLTLTMTEYRDGKAVASTPMEIGFDGIGSPREGTIALIPDCDERTVHAVISGDGTKLERDIPILESAAADAQFGRSVERISGQIPIRYGEQQVIAVFACGEGELHAGSVEDYGAGGTPDENDYAYCFSVTFGK